MATGVDVPISFGGTSAGKSGGLLNLAVTFEMDGQSDGVGGGSCYFTTPTVKKIEGQSDGVASMPRQVNFQCLLSTVSPVSEF